MPSIIEDTVFKEPAGGILALVYLAGALLFIGQYGYYVIIANYQPGNFILFMSVGFGLSGIAESLPTHRRRAAGVLRLAAIFVYISLLATLVFDLGVLIG
jgi:hypothetical protein